MSRSPLRAVFSLLVLAVVLLASTPRVSVAADITWTNAAGGDWSNSANWNSGAGPVPGPGDVAHITTNGTYTVNLDVDATVAGLELGAANGIQTLSVIKNTLILNGPATIGTQGVLTIVHDTLGGTGSLTNQGSIVLTGITVDVPLSNQGTVTYVENCNQNGAVTTSSGSMLRVSAYNSVPTLSVANGFTNNGTIELASGGSFGSPVFSVISGTLVSASGAAINVEAGSVSTERSMGRWRITGR